MVLKHYRQTFTGQEVEAAQLSRENVGHLTALVRGVQVEEIDPFDSNKRLVGINVPTPIGTQRCSEGDYLLHYDNYFFIRHPDDFAAAWEEM